MLSNFQIYRQSPIFYTVTGPVQDPLAVTRLNYIWLERLLQYTSTVKLTHMQGN